jgi:hypothetical protein
VIKDIRTRHGLSAVSRGRCDHGSATRHLRRQFAQQLMVHLSEMFCAPLRHDIVQVGEDIFRSDRVDA